MSDPYHYNAPHFVDFNVPVDMNDGSDKFFDIQTKIEKMKLEPSVDTSPVADTKENMSPPSHNTKHEEVVEPLMGNGDTVLTEMSPNITMKTRRNIFKPQENRKRYGSPLDMQPQKYISLAESVWHFAVDTPPRFRSHPKNRQGDLQSTKPSTNTHMTIPQNVHLATSTRNRKVNYPTKEEREQLELEDMKKHQIKAHPLDKAVLQPPRLGERVEKKPPTKVEPFHLTEYSKKKPTPAKTVFMFKANSIPQGLFSSMSGLPEKKTVPVTVPQTPRITKSKRNVELLEERDCENVMVEKELSHWGIHTTNKSMRTVVKPFTFEERDRQLLKKREQLIMTVLEQEKKAREFHANPLPRFVKQQLVDSQRELSSSSHASKEDANSTTSMQFRARPAAVLHQEPFKPRKADRPPLSVQDVSLHTEARAVAWKEFDQMLSERTEYYQQVIREKQERVQQEEAKEKLRLRKLAEFKATPVPTFPAPELVLARRTPTVPKSPNFSRRFKK